MTRKVVDEEVLQYLDSHSYDETMQRFGISRMTVARIKKRNQGRSDYKPNQIKVAIVGIGNAASALVQGLEYYKNWTNDIGLRHPTFGGYHISDIKIVAAFDVSARKVGKDLADAIKENDLPLFAGVSNLGVTVAMGPVLDGIIDETRDLVQPAGKDRDDVEKILHESGAEMVLCLLPSGATLATDWYAEQALAAGCAFINATPASIATSKKWAKRFQERGLPLIGDDLQDQMGATILHKLILQLMLDQGLDIKESYALDVGGGAESLNTIHRARDVKRAIKSMSVASSLDIDAPIVAGTSDYVPHLGNGRNTFLWIVGQGYLGQEIIMDIKIQAEDGPNGGSVLADIIRAAKIALNQGASGANEPISAYGFKNPPAASRSPVEAARALAQFVMGTKF